MVYLIDANVLITAHNSYYPVSDVPEFWDWVLHHAAAGRIKMPIEIYDEVRDGPADGERDLLFAWIQQPNVRRQLVLQEPSDAPLVRQVLAAYAADLNEDEVETIGKDPLLIASALRAADRTVVTCEHSAPGKQRANRRVPDVCQGLGVRWCDQFRLNKDLAFKTNWRPT